MREPLERTWQELRNLPLDQFKAYVLYARAASGEDLIALLLAASITTEAELALLLDMTLVQFRDLWQRLPLDNESLSKELGVTVERIYKLRFRAGNA